MPTLRKDIILAELKKAGISKAKMGKLLGFRSRTAFYKHFEKSDIDIDLFNSIINKLSDKGINIDSSYKQSIKSGRDSIVGESGTAIDELRKLLAKAEGKAETYKELYEQALAKIKELEKKK